MTKGCSCQNTLAVMPATTSVVGRECCCSAEFGSPAIHRSGIPVAPPAKPAHAAAATTAGDLTHACGSVHLQTIYKNMLRLFSHLPLAALVEAKVLILHGGLFRAPPAKTKGQPRPRCIQDIDGELTLIEERMQQQRLSLSPVKLIVLWRCCCCLLCRGVSAAGHAGRPQGCWQGR